MMALENCQTISRMVDVQVSGLVGPALDWAVAKVEGVEYRHKGIKCRTLITRRQWHHYTKPNFTPSTDWSQAGPLIEKHGICIDFRTRSRRWGAYCDSLVNMGDTPLIAICRAIVLTHLGDVVSVPAELVENK